MEKMKRYSLGDDKVQEVLQNINGIYQRSKTYNEYVNGVIEYARTQQVIPSEDVLSLATLISPVI